MSKSKVETYNMATEEGQGKWYVIFCHGIGVDFLGKNIVCSFVGDERGFLNSSRCINFIRIKNRDESWVKFIFNSEFDFNTKIKDHDITFLNVLKGSTKFNTANRGYKRKIFNLLAIV